MYNVVLAAVTAAFFASAGMGVAIAQDVVRDPSVIRSCLCEQQTVLSLQDAVVARRQLYESSQKSAVSLSNQVDTRRAQINVYSTDEIEAFKQLLQQRDAAAEMATTMTQDFDSVADRYNAAVAGYNGTCAGRSYDQAALAQAQATLACPRP
jgi:hypothetical protein